MKFNEMNSIIDIFNKNNKETACVHRVIKNNWLSYFLENKLGFDKAESVAIILFPDGKQSFKVTKKELFDSFKELYKTLFAIVIGGDTTQSKECIDFANNLIKEFGEELVHKYFYNL